MYRGIVPCTTGKIHECVSWIIPEIQKMQTDPSSDAWGCHRLSADVVERDALPVCPVVVPTFMHIT